MLLSDSLVLDLRTTLEPKKPCHAHECRALYNSTDLDQRRSGPYRGNMLAYTLPTLLTSRNTAVQDQHSTAIYCNLLPFLSSSELVLLSASQALRSPMAIHHLPSGQAQACSWPYTL